MIILHLYCFKNYQYFWKHGNHNFHLLFYFSPVAWTRCCSRAKRIRRRSWSTWASPAPRIPSPGFPAGSSTRNPRYHAHFFALTNSNPFLLLLSRGLWLKSEFLTSFLQFLLHYSSYSQKQVLQGEIPGIPQCMTTWPSIPSPSRCFTKKVQVFLSLILSSVFPTGFSIRNPRYSLVYD